MSVGFVFLKHMNIMIRMWHVVLALCVSLFGALRVQAQDPTINPIVGSMIQAAKTMKTDTTSKTVVEPCHYRVYYKIEYHPVAKTSSPSYDWIQLLQVGETAQRYLDYGSWQADSILDHGVKAGLRPEDFIPAYYSAAKRSLSGSHLLFRQTEGKVEGFDRILKDHFTYEEPIPHQQWELVPGDSVIAGYACHRAQTHYRGRDYTAWYTEEIPLSYGPYKFRGLPGLITCIYDRDRDYVFSLEGFERAPAGEIIYRKEREYFKTTRERLQEANRRYMANPGGYSSPQIAVQGKKPVRPPKPYNPIELE